MMFVGLIGARPLSLPPERELPTNQLSISLLPERVTPDFATAVQPAPLAHAGGAPADQLDEQRLLRAELLAARRAARVAERFRALSTEPVLAKPVPAMIAGKGPWMRGELVAQTQRLDLYVGKNTFSADQIAGRADKLERVLRAAEDYFGTMLDHRISLGFYRTPPKRGVRGMAYTDEGRVELFYRSGEDIGRATTIAMHEMGHHLEAQRYGDAAQRRADTVLHEGLATWIASIRWLDQAGAASWRLRGRQLRDAGIPLRLLTAERSGADNAYELWASFVDYLIRQYGWKKFDALYASGRGRAPGSAAYERVLGKSIDEVADDWRAWLGE
ncbi:MAG TPA: hypothetical protein VFU22_18295 [Roseiflexaceae bacterium]|nr:hypothetical protein [Roseiflexaceae bacterium]